MPPLKDDSEEKKLIQQQQILLLHAYKCMVKENDTCSRHLCRTLKDIFHHMATCNLGINCTHAHCSSSRRVIKNWDNSSHGDCACPVCSMKRLEIKNNNKPQNQQNPQQVGIGPQNSMLNKLQSNDSNANGAQNKKRGSLPSFHDQTANLRLSVSMLQQVNIPSLTQLRQQQRLARIQQFKNDLENIGAANGPVPNQLQNLAGLSSGWLKEITPDLREISIHKLLQLFPATDMTTAIHDKRMSNLLAYARKVEGDLYEMANSRSEYYHLLAEKIYMIQKTFEEMRQMRKKQQQAQQQQQENFQTSLPYNPNLMMPRMHHQQGPQVNQQDIFPDNQQGPQRMSLNVQQNEELNAICNMFFDQSGPVTKDWHRYITPDIRYHLISNFFQRIFPTIDARAMYDEWLSNILAFVKKLESDMYEMANSRSEYNNLTAVNVDTFRKIFEDYEEIVKSQPYVMKSMFVGHYGPAKKAWHRKNLQDMRRKVLRKIVRTMYPTSNAMSCPWEVTDFVNSIVTFETATYEKANSRNHYVSLVTEKLVEVQKKFQNKNSSASSEPALMPDGGKKIKLEKTETNEGEVGACSMNPSNIKTEKRDAVDEMDFPSFNYEDEFFDDLPDTYE